MTPAAHPSATSTADPDGAPPLSTVDKADAPRQPRVGEELPLFCERCGYSLNGLPQHRCDHCTVLQFHCPECNHHQPINTLRPAFQHMLARVRGVMLILSVLFNLNFFGWLLFAWFAMGVEWSYSYNYQSLTVAGPAGAYQPRYIARPVDTEAFAAFAVFGFAFGLIGRLLLLRWRRGLYVGLILGTVAGALAAAGGSWFSRTRGTLHDMPPLGPEFYALTVIGAGTIVLGAVAAWPAWLALVHLFLPARAARGLLDWQASLSDRHPDPNATRALARPA